ncbi:Lrp/AsnC family transcriptional regulator [Actinospica sp. MGRD01-02]|uniref:Lrp/AsnC family transcriptional regulator n=1 Tax=Actinospica acidithermotolerans TaxID=2828514 RepID=A0A941EG45_9ACTN|nr:Lrp/AsnC family transcriptional regulator [Actinospica acidithermotolerans]MBR7830691.1 Lrp/AsnC family transcriptional regulator [Actinospica acidithermotolerans]
MWVDILGGGNEISSVLFLDGPDARNALLLRDLPATADVLSWDAYDLMKVFPAGFAWSGGLLTSDQTEMLRPYPEEPADTPTIQPIDDALIDRLAINSRAGYSELAAQLDTSASTVSRRLETLVAAHVVRLACEVDLSLLGIRSEALLWITTGPGSLETIGQGLSRHPQVRFAAATTGAANLLVAVAAKDLSGLYAFVTGTIGTLADIRGVELTPILNAVKRTGRVRRSEPLSR